MSEKTMSRGYDVAQICRNGHAVNPWTKDSPEFNQDYCEKCGEGTITACAQCKKPIRGKFHYSGIISVGDPYQLPAYCVYCGNPFPWTQAKVEAAKELLLELKDVTEAETMQLAQDIEDLTRDTPSAPVATTRVKRFLENAGRSIAPALKEILIDIVTETAKKMLWG